MTGNLISRIGGGGDFYSRESVSSASSALLEPSGLFLCKAKRRVQAADKRHVYFLTIKLVFISEEMVLLIYLYIFYVVVVVFLLSLPLLLLPPQPRFCYLLARSVCGVCVSVCERRELFLGKPNKDKEGGWIQAASVSGPKGHPAVAWRERKEGGGKKEMQI